jgi:hypothetical protein
LGQAPVLDLYLNPGQDIEVSSRQKVIKIASSHLIDTNRTVAIEIDLLEGLFLVGRKVGNL